MAGSAGLGFGWCLPALPWVVGGVVAPSPALPALGGGVGCVVGLGVWRCLPCLPWVGLGGGGLPALPTPPTPIPPKKKFFLQTPLD